LVFVIIEYVTKSAKQNHLIFSSFHKRFMIRGSYFTICLRSYDTPFFVQSFKRTSRTNDSRIKPMKLFISRPHCLRQCCRLPCCKYISSVLSYGWRNGTSTRTSFSTVDRRYTVCDGG
jgi:hypothetical protein